MCSTVVLIFLGALCVGGVAESLESFIQKCKLLGSQQGGLRVRSARGKDSFSLRGRYVLLRFYIVASGFR